MILRGTVSSTEGGYRITIPDRENVVSEFMETAEHIGVLEVGDEVIAVFFTSRLQGVIIAKV